MANAGRNQAHEYGPGFEGNRVRHSNTTCASASTDFGLVHEHGSRTHVKRTILAVKQMLFELIPFPQASRSSADTVPWLSGGLPHGDPLVDPPYNQ